MMKMTPVGVIKLVSRNDHPQSQKVLYHLYCTDEYVFEMTTEEWDALPDHIDTDK